MPKIHPTAIVDPQAELSEDVEVGPYSIIGPHVKIGTGTVISSHVVIEGHTTLGEKNRVGHHTTLGQDPQDLKFYGEPATLIIGDNNDIREHVTMHIGTENGGGSTSVGSNNLIMIGSHVAHDSHIGSHVIMANNVLLAGHITIMDYAIVSGGAAIHHFVTIGRYAFIGGLSRVVHDCPPFMIVDGHPSSVRGVNLIGLARHRFEPETVERLKRAYRLLYRREGGGNQAKALAEMGELYASDARVMELCSFVRQAAQGSHGRYAEGLRSDDKRSAAPR